MKKETQKQIMLLSINKAIKVMVNDYFKRNGLQMKKQISSGGFFSSPTEDIRRVYSLNQLDELIKLGFGISEDVGMFVFNAINLYEYNNKQYDL